MKEEYKYDIAVSFAGEDRDFVEKIVVALRLKGVNVFYDELEKHILWGKNLYEYLAKVYKQQAKYCIVFVSKHYVKKNWTKHELKNAQSRAFKQNEEYILPIKIDNTNLPGLPDTIGYLDSKTISKEEIINIILKKLGYPTTEHSKIKKVNDNKNTLIYWQITSVINALDPIGLLPEAPADEYGVEVNAIIKGLKKAKNEEQLAILIQKIFAKYFSERLAGSYKRYLSAANQIIQITNNGTADYL